MSPNYFAALGIRPVLGRGFAPDEGTGRNAHPVTVISYQMWQERFDRDPAIIGKTQILNGLPYTIIGVAPQKFYGTFVGYAIQFWVPTSMQERFDAGGYKLEDRGAHWIEGFAKLKPAFGAGVGLVSTLLFGLFPALQASKVDLTAALKSESGVSSVSAKDRASARS